MIEKEEISVQGQKVVDTIKTLIHKGNVTRITVKDKSGKVLLSIPASVLTLGVLLAPFLAGASAGLALVSDCKIEVEKGE